MSLTEMTKESFSMGQYIDSLKERMSLVSRHSVLYYIIQVSYTDCFSLDQRIHKSGGSKICHKITSLANRIHYMDPLVSFLGKIKLMLV